MGTDEQRPEALSIRLLGPTAAARDGASLPLGGPKQRAVLAMLALRPGEHLSAEQLIAGLWGEDAPPAAGPTLRAYLSRLRAALGSGAVETGPAGPVLRLPADAVDVGRFTAALARGRAACASSAWEDAVRATRSALAEWRGPALADLRGLPFAGPAATRLERERRDGEHLLIVARLELGEHEELLPLLRRLADEQPCDERLAGQLMLALYRSGRQPEALEVYGRLRQQLVAELGVEPGSDVRSLHGAVLRQDPQLENPTGRGRRSPGAVPTATTSFVGRRAELATLRELVDRHRLVSLTGPPGVGKSRLALELAGAAQAVRSVRYVDLPPVALGRQLVPHLAAALGVPERPGSALVDTLTRMLAAADLLLVLDGADGVAEPVRELVGRLRSDCPALTVLVTAREPLGAPEERTLPVPPMPVRDAVALLTARAPAGTGLEPGARAALERVARAVAGNPLAVELAATRLADTEPAALAAQVEQRSGTVLTWAVAALTDDARRLLGRLSAFAGAFDAERAAVVAAAGVDEQLAALLRAALAGVEDAGGRPSYRLLPPVAAHARRLLEADGDATATAARHADAHAELAERVHQRLRGPDADAQMRRLDAAEVDLRVALEWSLAHAPVTALRLTGALAWYWYRRGRFSQGRAWCEAAARAAGQAPPALVARTAIGSAVLAYLGGDLAAMDRGLLHALDTAGPARLHGLVAQAHLYRVWACALQGEPGEARAALDLAREALRRTSCGWLEAEVHMSAGGLARACGDVVTAEAELDAARAAAGEHGHGWAATSATWLQAKLALEQGDPQRSCTLHRQCLEQVDVHHDLAGGLVTLNGLAAAVAATGNPVRGAQLLGAVEQLGAAIGYDPTAMDPLDGPRHVQLVRERLSDDEYAAAVEAGRRLTWAEALELAVAPGSAEPQAVRPLPG